MILTIAGQNYTSALDATHPLTIERKLNEPSICLLWLSLPAGGSLSTPTRNASISVTGDDGTPYFTGYIAVSPLPEYAGLALEGPRYRIAIQALSDELLLDQLLMPPSKGSSGLTTGTLLANLVTRTGSSALSITGLTLSAPISSFAPEPGASFSASAARIAGQARAAYRALQGALIVVSAGATVHPLNETDGSLDLASLSLTAAAKRALANDVTVCGRHEPVAYVTEYFLGDGATTTFFLSDDPFFPPTASETLISELFNEAAIDSRIWSVAAGPGYFSLGPAGLVFSGGSGIDGQTVLQWIDPIELGGMLLVEADSVALSPGSTGILAGLFSGLGLAADCIAGFQVSAATGTGAVSIQPLISGSASGSTFSINPANQYTLRIRIHSPELQRKLNLYRSFGNSGAITTGGESIASSALLTMDVQEIVDGVAATPVTLYAGSIADLAGAAKIAAASSLNLIGSMRAFRLTNLGSGWVVSTPSSGSPFTRRIGSLAQAAECHLERTGRLVFYTGFAPAAGEQVAVSYRTVGRSVGRAVNAASQAALAAAGLPAVATWIGTATNPAPRSSADCRNAALAIEQAAASVSALWSGTYKATRFSFAADVWPGDALLLNAPSTSLDAQVVVRSVKITCRPSLPDLFECSIAFANDWADDLAIKTSVTVPADAWLPAPVSLTVLANLNALTVTALTSTTVTIHTGVTAPSGGGFEIRRRDFAFMPGNDADLVARSSASTITLARQSASDRFYVRMYDNSSPPNYSEFSAALFINLPFGS